MTHAEVLREMENRIARYIRLAKAACQNREGDWDAACIAALRAGAEALEREEWRPIEGAPKDGEPILGYSKRLGRITGEMQTIFGRRFFVAAANGRPDVTHFTLLPAPPKEEA